MKVTGVTVHVYIGTANRKWGYPDHPTLKSLLLYPKAEPPPVFQKYSQYSFHFLHQKKFIFYILLQKTL